MSKSERDYNICLDIGGTKILGVVFDKKDKEVCRLKKKVADAGDLVGNTEKLICSIVDELIDRAGISKKQVAAIGVGCAGVIDQEAGVVLFSPNLPMRDYDIRTPMEKRYGAPFFIGNDVNVGVLGEYYYGSARGYNDVVGLFVGTGMGGGLILDGRLYTGHGHKAAEYGHMVLDPEGPLCGCGQRGCLEAFSSKKGMSAYIREQVARGRKTLMADEVASQPTFRSSRLKKALDAGDVVATEAVDRACHWLAVATGNLINTFSPEVVVFGGGVTEAIGDVMLKKIEAEVDRYCMPSIRKTVKLVQAGLGDDSLLWGDLAMIKGLA